MKKYRALYKSPLGVIEMIGSADAIYSLIFVEKGGKSEGEAIWEKDFGNIEVCDHDTGVVVDQTGLKGELKNAMEQLHDYFQGNRTIFDVNVDLRGTPFQKMVWDQLTRIRYGETMSYKDVATAIKNPNAVRAVGGANGKNPISIIVPCHRVITHDGKIGGYGGGLWRQEWLLDHEQKMTERLMKKEKT